MTTGCLNLREFIAKLREEEEIVEIHHEVNPSLELAEIHRRVAAVDGPALLFRRVKGSDFPVVTNLFGSKRRVHLAFANRPEEVVARAVKLATRDFPPSLSTLWANRDLFRPLMAIGTSKRKKGPIQECVETPPNLHRLPMLKSWPLDGGDFITLPLVYTEPPGGGPPNLGMYRIQRHSATETGLHWQIGKGGGFHFHQAESQNQPLPVNIFVGGPPALILSAIAPLPENVPEILLASLLQGKHLDLCPTPHSPYPLISECEFALVGQANPGVRRMEGPFGDHYGYYSWAHDFPVFECRALYHRKDAIYPATVVGKPRQEDFYIGDYLQELLSPLFPVVMPAVRDLWSYGETGFHSLSAAVVKERYHREAMASAFRILGEGQLSLTKFLLLTDQPVNLRNIKETLPTILERFRPERDLYVFANLSLDTLDYTGPELNKGSRGVMVGLGPVVRDLPEHFQGSLPRPLLAAEPFCRGCLVVEAPVYDDFREVEIVARAKEFREWPLVIVVDSLTKALRNTASFLWTVFTRFEPAADLYAANTSVYRHHLCYQGPIVIDARMKPSYPPEVACDEQTAYLVTENWNRYFPDGMPMGSSDLAHVC